MGYLHGTYGLQDYPGAPGLERLLREAPQTIIIGHGQGFWAEIGAGLTMEEKMRYPQGPLKGEGALPRLLRTYPNLYGDISAGSGHNAPTRIRVWDSVSQFQDRLLFTRMSPLAGRSCACPIRPLGGPLEEGKISQEVYDKITHRNACGCWAWRVVPITGNAVRLRRMADFRPGAPSPRREGLGVRAVPGANPGYLGEARPTAG